MAIRAETFRKLGLEKIWAGTISDDLSLTTAVKKENLLVAYVPACLVASFQQCNWPGLFEFGRRQFLITRINRPGVWWFGITGAFYTIAGQWVPLAAILLATGLKSDTVNQLLTITITFFGCEFIRAILRQKMALTLLMEERKKLIFSAASDIVLCWLWTIVAFVLMISSAFGRTICWRGLKYKLTSPSNTTILTKSHK